jgi:hypothetical protein
MRTCQSPECPPQNKLYLFTRARVRYACHITGLHAASTGSSSIRSRGLESAPPMSPLYGLKKKKQIGAYASPQEGFGLSTPRGTEGGGQRLATRDKGGKKRGCKQLRTPSRGKKEPKSGTTPDPNGASASAPQAGRNGRGQHPATRDTGGSARADRERRTSPEAGTHEPAGTASSATEAPTERTKAAITEHTSSRREQPRRKEKGFKSQGMQCARIESASKEST